MPYMPSQGDIILMDFHPQSGHEQTGRRPALVISNHSFHQYTNLCIVCPITTKKTNFPLHLQYESDLIAESEIICEHLITIDFMKRNTSFYEKVSKTLLNAVIERIYMFLEVEKIK